MKKTALFVLGRPLPTQPRTGRDRQLSAVIEAASAQAEVHLVVMENRLSARVVEGLFVMACKLLLELLRGRPLPLQCALYDSGANKRLVSDAISSLKPDVVYLDTVRCSRVLFSLRHLMKGRRVICNFEDLMSRRMAVVSAMDNGVSLGFLAEKMPRATVRVLERIAALVPRYESWSLAKEERRIAIELDAVCFVSSAEANTFRGRMQYRKELAIEGIPPPFVLRRRVPAYQQSLDRYIFIGSDGLLQNRLTIDLLLKLWAEQRPRTPLCIFGDQKRSYSAVDNVQIMGSVASLDEVYRTGSILLAPALVPGGVKTKVVEALGYGIPVIGNTILFEGVAGSESIRKFSEPEIAALLHAPEAVLPTIYRDAASMQDALIQHASHDVFRSRWQSILGLA